MTEPMFRLRRGCEYLVGAVLVIMIPPNFQLLSPTNYKK